MQCLLCTQTHTDVALAATASFIQRLSGNFTSDVVEGVRAVEALLPVVSAFPRTPAPISTLKVALQCGGSDAFSGISGECVRVSLCVTVCVSL